MEIINLLLSYIPIVKPYFNANSFYKDIQIKDIKCGKECNLALDSNGNMYSWKGHFEHGDKIKMYIRNMLPMKVIEIQCGLHHFYAKTDRNEHFLWGNNECNQCLTFDGRDYIDEPFCIND